MWLLGIWGANYTLLDLSVEEALVASRPDLASQTVTPVRAVKKTMMILLLGLALDIMAVIHAVVNKESEYNKRDRIGCEEEDYFYGYSWNYNMYVVGILHFVLPFIFLLLAVSTLIVIFVRERARDRLTQTSGMYIGTPAVFSLITGYKKQQFFVVFLVGSHASLSAMYSVTFVRLLISQAHTKELETDQQNAFVHDFRVAEFCQLASATIAPFFLSLWPNYRAEVWKVLCGCCDRKETGPNLSTSRSAYSLTGFQ